MAVVRRQDKQDVNVRIADSQVGVRCALGHMELLGTMGDVFLRRIADGFQSEQMRQIHKAGVMAYLKYLLCAVNAL